MRRRTGFRRKIHRLPMTLAKRPVDPNRMTLAKLLAKGAKQVGQRGGWHVTFCDGGEHHYLTDERYSPFEPDYIQAPGPCWCKKADVSTNQA